MMNMNNRYRNNINRNCNQNVSAVVNNSSPEKKNDECVEVETVSKDVSAQGCGCNTNVNIRNMDRKVCLKKIYELGFAITETALYLDTHPEDKDALEYYCGIRNIYHDMSMQYAEYYGPLTYDYVFSENYWMWVATPMPWEVV